MEMFLMLIAMSLLGTAVSAALFAAATHGEKREVAPGARKQPVASRRFFVPAGDAPETASAAAIDGPGRTSVPLETLLLRIERHVQLEQAAAEFFHDRPTGESLHSRTASPLVN